MKKYLLITANCDELNISKNEYLFLVNNTMYAYQQGDWELLSEVDELAKSIYSRNNLPYEDKWFVKIINII